MKQASASFAIGKYLAFLIVVFSILSVQASSQQLGTDQPLPDDLYNLYLQKRELIHQAISDTQNEWAGTYLAGDHHPTVFMWEPAAGFLVSSSLHTFSPSWMNYGNVVITDSFLTIYPELTKENNSAHVMPGTFRLVRWDKQHFLIPPERLRSFAYDVHSGAESQIVQYFSRGEDLDDSRSGLPNLPDVYTGIMRMPAIVARITAVGPEQAFSQEVTLGAGQRQRVIEGMYFYYSSGNGAQFSVRITDVSERSSKGEVWLRATTGRAAEWKVKVGLRLSSKMPKGFIEPG